MRKKEVHTTPARGECAVVMDLPLRRNLNKTLFAACCSWASHALHRKTFSSPQTPGLWTKTIEGICFENLVQLFEQRFQMVIWLFSGCGTTESLILLNPETLLDWASVQLSMHPHKEQISESSACSQFGLDSSRGCSDTAGLFFRLYWNSGDPVSRFSSGGTTFFSHCYRFSSRNQNKYLRREWWGRVLHFTFFFPHDHQRWSTEGHMKRINEFSFVKLMYFLDNKTIIVCVTIVGRNNIYSVQNLMKNISTAHTSTCG